MAERPEHPPAPGKPSSSLTGLPSLLPQGAVMLSPHSPDPSWLFISGHGSSSDCRKGGSGCDKRGSKLLDLLPLPGLLLLTGSTTNSDSPCSSPLSPLRASRLACVHLCGEEHRTAPLTTSPCCSATSAGVLPPAQPSTLSPEPAAHQREVTRLPDPPGPWARAPRRATNIARAGQGKDGTSPPMGEYLRQVYGRNFSLCLGMIMSLAIPPFSHNYSQPSTD